MAPTPSAQYSLTLRVEIDHRPGMLGKVASAIGDAGGTIGAVDLVQVEGSHTIRDITVETSDSSDWPRLADAVNGVPGARVLDATDRTFLMHVGGKIELNNKSPLKTREDLSMAYTPGVARVCGSIYRDPDKAFQYTIKRNTVAVVSDGSAVLGLGNIGPRAAMPVMEGKAMLFKEFAGVDAFPDLPRHPERGRDRRGRARDRARVRRREPGGHLSPALLRDRGTAWATSWTSRCSTTTSTGPRWSCWRRC